MDIRLNIALALYDPNVVITFRRSGFDITRASPLVEQDNAREVDFSLRRDDVVQ